MKFSTSTNFKEIWLKLLIKQAFKEQCKQYHSMLDNAKTEHHRSEITECNSKQLFATINKLCRFKTAKVLPSGEEAEVADRFGDYFTGKIAAIRSDLDTLEIPPAVTAEKRRDSTAPFCQFQELSEQEVRHVHDCMKVARVTPITKKASLDPEVLSNYRPVSNLSFISKLNERVVCSQLHEHLAVNGLYNNNNNNNTLIIAPNIKKTSRRFTNNILKKNNLKTLKNTYYERTKI